MAITSSDVSYRLSGGAANSSGAASLGGAISGTVIQSAAMNNLWDNVSADEAAVGDTEYRCIYLANSHPDLVWENVVIWVESNTPSSGTTGDIGLGTSAIGGVEQTVANEQTAPAGVVFSSPVVKSAALSIGDIPPGQHKAIWMRRIVTAGATAMANDGIVIRAEGESAA